MRFQAMHKNFILEKQDCLLATLVWGKIIKSILARQT